MQLEDTNLGLKKLVSCLAFMCVINQFIEDVIGKNFQLQKQDLNEQVIVGRRLKEELEYDNDGLITVQYQGASRKIHKNYFNYPQSTLKSSINVSAEDLRSFRDERNLLLVNNKLSTLKSNLFENSNISIAGDNQESIPIGDRSLADILARTQRQTKDNESNVSPRNKMTIELPTVGEKNRSSVNLSRVQPVTLSSHDTKDSMMEPTIEGEFLFN